MGSKIPGACYSGKKKPLPGSLQTVVRCGEAPPDGPFLKVRELADSKHVLMNIHQNSIQALVNKQKKRMGQIQAVA